MVYSSYSAGKFWRITVYLNAFRLKWKIEGRAENVFMRRKSTGVRCVYPVSPVSDDSQAVIGYGKHRVYDFGVSPLFSESEP